MLSPSPILEMRGGYPDAISLLIAMALRNKDQRIAWDISNVMMCEFTYSGQPLTFQSN